MMLEFAISTCESPKSFLMMSDSSGGKAYLKDGDVGVSLYRFFLCPRLSLCGVGRGFHGVGTMYIVNLY